MLTSFFAQKQAPIILLRVGLGLVLLYAALASLLNPDDWIGYVPEFATNVVSGTVLLKLLALYQLALVVWLASGVRLGLAGLVCAATFCGILLANLSLMDITFRDIGLIFAALALAALAFAQKK